MNQIKRLTHQSFIVTFISILFLGLLGCDDNSVEPHDGTAFYPLSVGNKWTYDAWSYDTLGVLINQGQFTDSIPKYEINDDQFIFEIRSPLFFYHNEEYYLQQKKDGIHFLVTSIAGHYIYNDYLSYKYPTFQNDFFTNGRYKQDTTFVVSINDTVICNAGRFSSIVYQDFNKEYISNTEYRIIGYAKAYVSSGIGKIKYEYYQLRSDNEYVKTWEYSLNSYTFK